MAPKPRIGTRIKRARERLRMSQEELAEAVGVHRVTISQWEADGAYPRSSIGALEDVLGISLDDGDSAPELVSDELRALIYREFSAEDAALALGAIEQTLKVRRITSPGGSRAAGQAPG